MENPATWTLAEYVVEAALDNAERQRALGLVGLSKVRIITDALRQAGLLIDTEDNDEMTEGEADVIRQWSGM